MLAKKQNRTLTQRESTTYMLLLLFVSFFVGISFFKHKHIVNGVLIVHSHPFSPTENHNHSAETTSLIQQLSHFDTRTATLATLALNVSFLLQIITTDSSSLYLESANDCYHFTRPPPTPSTH